MRREAALASPAAAPSVRGIPTLGTMADPVVPVPALYRFSWHSLPRDLKFLAIGLVLVLVGGVAFLFVPWRPKPTVPLLGWSEPVSGQPRPTPPPRKSPAPAASPAPKKGWLPW